MNSTTRHIKAEHVLLALVARKANPRCCWAAMSNGAHTQSCGGRPYHLRQPPLLSPMTRGNFARVVERTRLEHGLREVRRTWGLGLRALQAETQSAVIRPAQS